MTTSTPGQQSRQHATKLLEVLRGGTPQHGQYVTLLLEELHQSGLTPEDLDTTVKEIEEFRVLGCMVVANQLLGYLRDGVAAYELCLSYLMVALANGRLTLADVETSKEELELLRQKSV